jgi:hypothetical protein
MPYLMQRLSIDDAVGQFDAVTGDVYYRLTASINKGGKLYGTAEKLYCRQSQSV